MLEERTRASLHTREGRMYGYGALGLVVTILLLIVLLRALGAV
jgi:hypothetical protein